MFVIICILSYMKDLEMMKWIKNLEKEYAT